jgi:hypothetical protein
MVLRPNEERDGRSLAPSHRFPATPPEPRSPASGPPGLRGFFFNPYIAMWTVCWIRRGFQPSTELMEIDNRGGASHRPLDVQSLGSRRSRGGQARHAKGYVRGQGHQLEDVRAFRVLASIRDEAEELIP